MNKHASEIRIALQAANVAASKLEDENQRLREQNNPCRGHMEDYPHGVCWLCEIKRLREALEAVYSFKDDWYATVCEAIQESGDETS